MRARALLFLAMLATTLGASAAGASAATLFTSAAHTTRVTAGATADMTSVTPFDVTNVAGALSNRCTHSSLGLRVDGNTTGPVSLTVTGSTFSGGCVGLGQVTGTHTQPWKATLSDPIMVGAHTVYTVTVDVVILHIGNFQVDGTLELGTTARQPTVATAPICLDLKAASGLSSPILGSVLIDASYCMTGAAAAWSLT